MNHPATERTHALFSWIGGALALAIVAGLLVLNAQRAFRAEQNRRLVDRHWVFGPLVEAAGRDVIGRWGWLFEATQQVEAPIDGLTTVQRFTVRFRLCIETLDAFDLRLLGKPASVDLTLSRAAITGEPAKRLHTVLIERYPDRAELWFDGRQIDQRPIAADSAFHGFFLKSFASRVTVQSVWITGPGGRVLFADDFAFPFRSPRYMALGFLGIAALFVLGAWLTSRGRPFAPRLSPMLFAATPLWAGSLFPLNLPTNTVFIALAALVLLPTVGRRLVPLAGRERRTATIILVLPAFAMPAVLWPGDVFATGRVVAALLGAALLCGLWLTFRRAQLDPWRALSVACYPASLGLPIALAWTDGIGLAAALWLVTAIMLLQLGHAHRRELPGYLLLMIVLAGNVIGAAELNAHHSAFEARWRPMNIGKNFTPDKDLMYVPGELMEHNNPFRIGQLRFRDSSPSTQPAPGVFRLITMGGSNTWGQEIDHNSETFSGVLESCLNRSEPRRFEVLNAGAKGFFLFQILKLFEHYALTYQPNAVVLYIGINENILKNGPFTYRQLWSMKNSGELARLTQQLRDERETRRSRWGFVVAVQDQLRVFRLYNALVKPVIEWRQRALQRVPSRFQFIKDVNPVEDFRANLTEFIALCRAHGVAVAVVEEYQSGGVPIPGSKDYRIRQAMRKITAREHVPFLPLNEILHQQPDQNSLVFDFDPGHLSYRGHQEVGKMICEFLAREQVVPR